MRRVLVVWAILLVAVAPAGAAGAAGAAAQEDTGAPVRKVLIVSLPRLTWETLDERGTPPVLRALLERSAVASMSPRTIGPTTTLGEGYATIGAGNRATVATAAFSRQRVWLDDGEAALAFDATESYDGEPASQVYRRRTGRSPTAPVLHLGIHSLRAANDALLYDAEVGALGEALRGAGRSAAVVANADQGSELELLGFHREAALAVMDEAGQAAGDVTTGLLVGEGEAPFGVVLDENAVVRSFDEAWDRHDVVLVENSDLERVDAFKAVAAEEVVERHLAAALDRFDRILAALLDRVDPARDVVMVAAPAPPRGVTKLTVFAMAGPGIEPGVARSATTRRAGYVTLPDVGPTVLDVLGVEAHESMTGTAITSTGGRRFDDRRVQALVAADERARFRDAVHGPLSTAFIVFQVLVYGLAVFALARQRQRLLGVARFGALVVLAVPPLMFLSGLVPYRVLGGAGYAAALAAAAVALAVGARALGRGRLLVPPLVLTGLSVVVLVVDIVTGGRLQLDTVFGYSPIVAGRFAGYGNLAFAMLTATVLVAVTAGWGLVGGGRRALAVAAAVFALVVVVDGLPAFGSDVGGVLTTVPAFAVTLSLLAGVRVGLKRVALIVGGTVAALAVFAAIDVSRPESSRTHLGRLVADVFDEGGAGLATVLARKASANLSILTSSVWTYVIPVAFLFLAFLVWRRQGFLRAMVERVPGLQACLTGVVVAGVVGFSLNDSGVAVPAMMLAVLLPYLTWLVEAATPAAPAGSTTAGTPHGAGTRS